MSEPGTNNPDGTAAPPRQLGFWMCLALVVGNMIGSGIFLLPASLAPYGLNSIFGWIFSATGGVLLAIVFAQLVARLSAGRWPVRVSARRFRRMLRLRHGVGLLDVGVGRQRRDRDRHDRVPVRARARDQVDYRAGRSSLRSR